MSPDEARAWLDAITGRGWKLTLERVTEVLRRLGDPQAAFHAIHITGTNGKGSCAAFVEGLLGAAGAVTGCNTSPHVIRVEERIRIRGADSTPEELAGWLTAVREAAGEDQPVTYFEAVTSAAFLAFRERGVTHAAVEVGLGGRLDATRLCRPSATVITTVGLDHTRLLGSTPAAIAAEKAGILRPGIPLITAATGEALEVLAHEAARIGAPLRVLERDFRMEPSPKGWRYTGPLWDVDGLVPSLEGPHQARNAACAVGAFEALAATDSPVGPDHLAAGLAAATIRGRFERHRAPRGGIEMIVDCAHNAQGGAALAQTLDEALEGRRIHLVYGALKDKKVVPMLDSLGPRAQAITLVTVEAGPRTRPAASIAAEVQALPDCPVDVVDDPIEAVQRALAAAPAGSVVLVAGSVYLAGEVLGAVEQSGFWLDAKPHANLPNA